MRESFNYPKNIRRPSGRPEEPLVIKAILKKEENPDPPVEEIKRTHRQPSWMATDMPSTPSMDDGNRPILYLSIDVETDGPVPGIYSMLSIGMAAFSLQNEVVWERELNLFPLEGASKDHKTMDWWKQEEQQAAWEHLMQDRQDPKEAFIRLTAEIKELKKHYRVFTIAWPACFDWMFLHWYMHKFVGENPLGRRAKCADTYAWAISRTLHPNVSIDVLLEEWEDDRFKHTHRALDDAKEQGAKFINMLTEMTRNGHDYRLGYDKNHHHHHRRRPHHRRNKK